MERKEGPKHLNSTWLNIATNVERLFGQIFGSSSEVVVEQRSSSSETLVTPHRARLPAHIESQTCR
jgi:hypothetical protein